MSVEIPKCAIAFGSVAPPQGDVIDLRVHLGCTKEVSSFEVLLQNWDKKYSPGGTSPINVGMDGHIDIGRGSNVPQIITLRVEEIRCESSPTENYIRVSGRCWGEKLFRKVVTKNYDYQKGEAIVKDLMDSYVGLSHVRDSTELVENTDTTFTHLEYENSPVWDILKYIAESSDLAGVIGYDFRVAPDGKFEFFPKNSKTSSVSLSEKIEASVYRKDILRIRNKITVYGVANKNAPSDGDAWTEASLDGWTVTSPAHIGIVNYYMVGTHSIEAYCDIATEGNIVDFKLTHVSINKPSKLVMWLYKTPYADDDSQSYIRILAPDASNYYQINWADLALGYVTWKLEEFDLSAGNVYDVNKNPNGKLHVVGNPSFILIQAIQFHKVTTGASTGTNALRVDGLCYMGIRFSYITEDSGSQNLYGLRELTETDEELESDNECALRAKALLAYLKDPAEYLTVGSTVLDYGSTPLLAGDKIHVTLPNENVDTDYRIETVEYKVDAKTQTLEITLELGKVPPLLADYIYGLRATTVTVEKLARTKLGRGAAAGGGGGGGGSVPEWIWPTYIGPRNDVVAITNFRTKNIAGTSVVDHHFDPSDNEHGLLGRDGCRWLEIWTKYLNASASAKVGQLNIGDITVITSARILQNVLADAGIITSGNFLVDRLARGTAGYVLEAEGAGLNPMYVNPNYRYSPKSHAHSEHTSIGPNDHHAQSHNHAGESLSPSGVSCNTMSIAVSCNRQYSHPSNQQCVYAGSVAWENCPRFYSYDIIFVNKFRITEAEKLGFKKGLAFLNPKGKPLMVLDGKGNLSLAGKIKKLKNVKRG